MRKLASIQQVNAINSILNAERVEEAIVGKWHVVVKKGELNPGDKVVYFEIDSLLPEDNPKFDFLKNQKGKIPALKTRRICGVYSQGLAMPLSEFPDITTDEVGTDLTEVLKVTKYEPPEFDGKGSASMLGDFPSFIPKSDEERCQTFPVLDRLEGIEFGMTEKLDGSSVTVYIKGNHVGICSRNREIDPKDKSSFGFIFTKYKLEEAMKSLRIALGADLAIQGEMIGMGIQGNKYKLNGVELHLFNLINIETGEEFSITDEDPWSLGFVSEYMGVPHVPYLGSTTMVADVDKLIDMAKGNSVLRTDYPREGIVFRIKDKLDTPPELKSMHRLSLKAINPEFLVK